MTGSALSRSMLAACLGTASLAAISAHAQTTGPGGRLVYEAAYFTTYAPSNALQIVQRTPGFRLEIGDEEVRGFSQAAGNVVINGERPSSKSETLDTILARIPASRVARVEVGPGSLFGADYSQVSQVLNLVLTTTSGLSGTFEGTVRRDFTGQILPQATASALLKRGKSTFNASVGVVNATTSEEGFDRVTLPDGSETEFRRKVNTVKNPVTSGSLAWTHEDGTNRSAHVNAQIERDRFVLTQANAVFPREGDPRDDRLAQRFGVTSLEIGGDITRPFAGGGLKLIGLATRRHRVNAEESLLRVEGDVVGGFAQNLDNQRDETVVRLVWTHPSIWGWTVETGLEGALNTLDSKVDLFGIDVGGTRTRIDLPVDDARVEEWRGEGFLNLGRPLAKTLRLDVGVTYEASRLTVSGDADARRSLRFVKPKATLDWRSRTGWHGQVSVERTVAQLQFEDFISSAELASDRVNGGNANLVPQRAWEVRATIERPILGDGLIRLELGRDRISLVQDRIPTPEGFDAPGNLGNGTSTIVRGRIDAPLDRLGIKGGRLTLYGSYVGTSVVDPYTLTARRFSNDSDFFFEGSFRQDLGRFAYGIDVEGGTASTVYRQNELDRFSRQFPVVSAFAEYRPDAKTTVTAGIQNLTSATATRNRSFFLPDRRSTVADVFELRSRDQNLLPYLTIKRSFG